MKMGKVLIKVSLKKQALRMAKMKYFEHYDPRNPILKFKRIFSHVKL